MSINDTIIIINFVKLFLNIIFNILVYMIKFDDYVSANNKYPERLKSSELTDEVVVNINRLLDKVNNLLNDLGITATVSSGFRPSDVNAKIANAAKKSNHMTGLAVDLADGDGKLDKLFMANLPLLEKWGLHLEHPDATAGWSHLQCIAPKSGNRVFKP